MSTRIAFFMQEGEAKATHAFLNSRGVKTFTRSRGGANAQTEEGESPYGFDLFVLSDEEADDAIALIEYEFGKEWGEAGRKK